MAAQLSWGWTGGWMDGRRLQDWQTGAREKKVEWVESRTLTGPGKATRDGSGQATLSGSPAHTASFPPSRLPDREPHHPVAGLAAGWLVARR